ncbi:hypothetical protein EDC19_2260 [Natranaerovirga hydrolytica]|uniref:Phosphoesterase n=1 Tax=Natranaerovirga hydrolytica TaxID=680378 RepID=A0A4R1MDB0_9FIRM|nr:metallophosphoesterase [Natranaerovirga hydrolytica]TCK90498.1 hypothetical protein EDC19_2260 [Natranaerovirga hydrolytica]
MKILVISDTHNEINNVVKIIKNNKSIDMILHLGDVQSDYKKIKQYYFENITYVSGNCDYISKYPKEKIIEIEGKKILMTHGHKYNVKWEYDTIKNIGFHNKVDGILFGHTHIPYLEENEDLVLMNPGSITLPRESSTPTYGILEIEKNKKMKCALCQYTYE